MSDADNRSTSFQAFDARYRNVRRQANRIAVLTQGVRAGDVGGGHLADLRDIVEELTRSFHEANAYHNAIGHKPTELKEKTDD